MPESAPPTPAPARCILLAESSAAVPVELLTGLTRRGMAVVVVSDEPAVMVQLARGGAAALVVADANRVPRLPELAQAIRDYYPRTGCWEYTRRGGSSRLVRLDSPQDAEVMPGNGSKKPVSNPDTPVQAVAEDDHTTGPRTDRLRSLVVHLPPPTEVNEPLISSEELAMLLGEPGEGSTRQGRED